MQSKAKTRIESMYINFRKLPGALTLIDESFIGRHPDDPCPCYPPRPREEVRRSQLDKYWGRKQGHRKTFEIGVRGKVMALCALRPHIEEKDSTFTRLAEAIIKSAQHWNRSERIPEVRAALSSWKAEGQDELDKKTFLRLRSDLNSLIRPTYNREFPPLDRANEYLTLVAGFFADLTSQKHGLKIEQTAQSINECLDRSYARPSECTKALVRALHLDVEGSMDSDAAPDIAQRIRDGQIHYFEPGLENYISNAGVSNRGRSELSRHAEEIRNEFSEPGEGHSPLVVITGDPHAGKKAVVGDLIIALGKRNKGSYLLVTADAEGRKLELPIFAINARRRDYLMLVLEILVFLDRYSAPPDQRSMESFESELKRRLELEGSLGNLTLDNLLSRVESLHSGHPALFVIMDVQGSQGDSVLKVLGSYGINRLLRTLLRNSNSRILITDAEDNGDTYGKIDGVENPKIIELAPPTVRRLKWYTTAMSEVVYPALDKITPSKRNLSTTGAALIALAALLGEVKDEETARAAILKHTDELETVPGQATELMFKRLLDHLQPRGLIPSLALMCASEDGLLDRSLKYSLDHWPTAERPKPWLEYSEASARLDALHNQSSFLVLRREGAIHVDREEYAFDEPVSAPLREVGRDLAEKVVEVMLQDEERRAILRLAHRQVSIAARRRAQIKKMRSSTVLGFTQNAEARDIQSYISLLASIDPKSVRPALDYDAPTDEPAILAKANPVAGASRSLRLSSSLVFTAGQEFDPRIALRFAVRCLLREDIDRDFRLSMISDQDALRLKLYLLVFCDLGRPHYWTVESLRQDEKLEALPTKVPDHLSAVFSVREILDLLVTISLSGFHCQFPRITNWALEMAMTLEPPEEHGTPARQSWWAAVTRIRCSAVDMIIQQGRDQHTLLKQLRTWMEMPDGSFDVEAVAALPWVPGEKLEATKAWMRLAAREAELVWSTTGNEAEVMALYDRISDLEHKLAESIDQDDPVVLSGRTARRFVKFLSKDAPVYRTDTAPKHPVDVMQERDLRIREMLEANISRLRRFSGAERVTVLVDMARRHHLTGRRGKALEYARLARNTMFSGSVSHGGKIDVLGVNAGLHLFEAEQLIAAGGDPDAIRQHLEHAEDCYELLLQLARALKYEPAKSVGQYLSARAKFAKYELHKNEPTLALEHAQAAWELLERATDFTDRMVPAQMQHLSDLIHQAINPGPVPRTEKPQK